MSETATQARKPRRTAGPLKGAGPDWIRTSDAAKIIQRSERVVADLAARGLIRVHRPPGTMPLYYKPDCEKFAPPAP